MARLGRLWRRFTGWLTAPRAAALLLGFLGVLLGFAGYLYRYCSCSSLPNIAAGWEQLFLDFYANVAASLVTITITVLTIDWLGERRAEKQLKKQLIREMGSSDNGIATRAVRELRAHGWLTDGSLREADLWRANLEGANLEGADLEGAALQRAALGEAHLEGAILGMADLEGADLRNANLQAAWLIRANLRGARNLTNKQLAAAYVLANATMKDGSPYDGRFKLVGDIQLAVWNNINPEDPEAMARYYGVTLEEYLAGRKWTCENLARVRREAGLEQDEAAETEDAAQPEEHQSAAPSRSVPRVLSTQSLLSFTVRRLIGLFWPF